jgi:hypothetical protein
MLPATVERVPLHTADELNERIRRQTEANVAYYELAGPEAVEGRLAELDHEWDIERTLETNASIAVLAGVALGATVHRNFFFLPAVIAGFLLQHATQGWCPPVPLFRRLGVRTQTEIEEERYALKALRGDFQRIPNHPAGRPRAPDALEAVRA